MSNEPCSVVKIDGVRFRTFHEWSLSGYKINKGAAARWIDGVAMFSSKQVTKTSKPASGNQWKDCTPKGTAPHWMQDDYEYDDSPDAHGFFYS